MFSNDIANIEFVDVFEVGPLNTDDNSMNNFSFQIHLVNEFNTS